MTGHKIATKAAVSLVERRLRTFFSANLESLVAFSNEPDVLSKVDSKEVPSHFLDLDLFGESPFVNIPADEKAFVAQFGAEALEKGRLPWAVRDTYDALVRAFEKRNYEEILRNAGHLSHYVADATMPLHATKNYKGQSSGNVIFEGDAPDRHVHVRFEIGMIDAYRDAVEKGMASRFGRVRRIANPAEEAMALLKLSYAYIDPILEADKALLASGEKPTPSYYAGMYDRVGDIAERQLALAATEVASFWTSAWEAGGKPKLPDARVVLVHPPLVEAPLPAPAPQAKVEGTK